jgi:hypothetical protein
MLDVYEQGDLSREIGPCFNCYDYVPLSVKLSGSFLLLPQVLKPISKTKQPKITKPFEDKDQAPFGGNLLILYDKKGFSGHVCQVCQIVIFVMILGVVGPPKFAIFFGHKFLIFCMCTKDVKMCLKGVNLKYGQIIYFVMELWRE